MDDLEGSHFVVGRIGRTLDELATFQNDHSRHLSPQLTKRLTQLFACPLGSLADLNETARQAASLFDRLLLELIQAQCNSKQLEQAYIRHIECKGCSIRDPQLTDHVIELLIRIYKAAGQCSSNDTSYERKILIKYIMKELGPEQEFKKKQIERIIQTIYRCSCFQVTQQVGAASRFSLREELCDSNALRHQLDVQLINMARDERIRLPPENWAYLLHGRSTPANIARVQSILDKHTAPVDVDELEHAIHRSGDRFGLSCFIGDLRYIQDLTRKIRHSQLSLCVLGTGETTVEGSHYRPWLELVSNLDDVLRRLSNLKHLFTVRQQRAKLGVF